MLWGFALVAAGVESADPSFMTPNPALCGGFLRNQLRNRVHITQLKMQRQKI